jgi:hypothetical protein
LRDDFAAESMPSVTCVSRPIMNTNPPALPYRGACLCGAVRYEVDSEINRASHCHCSMCRKAHGAAFATYGTVPKATFRITQGADALRSYASSPGITRNFCMHCGSPITWLSDHAGRDGEVGFTLGTLETPLPPPADQWHIYTASKASWYTIEDKWPQWSERRPRKPASPEATGDASNE